MMTTEQLIEQVCEANGLTVEQVRSKSRKWGVVEVRQVASYLAYKFIADQKCASTIVGNAVNRDRTSILYTVRMVDERIRCNDRITMEVINKCFHLI